MCTLSAVFFIVRQRHDIFAIAMMQVIIPVVIGRGGMMVNKIMKESKAKVVLKERTTGPEWDVLITGASNNVAVGDRGLISISFLRLIKCPLKKVSIL